MKHIVMWSGGITSWATARHVIERYGTASTTLLFADTNAEDEDLYTFNEQASAQLGMQITRVADPQERDPWQVFEDKRWLGNTRIAQCSKILKIDPCEEWLGINADPDHTTLYVGLDWTEPHRIPGNRAGWAPWQVEYPLTEPPYLDKEQLLSEARSVGLAIPRLYRLGFPHNNCGGGCQGWRRAVGSAAGGLPAAVRPRRARRDQDAESPRQGRVDPPRPDRRHHHAADAHRAPGPHRGAARPAGPVRRGRLRLLHGRRMTFPQLALSVLAAACAIAGWRRGERL